MSCNNYEIHICRDLRFHNSFFKYLQIGNEETQDKTFQVD